MFTEQWRYLLLHAACLSFVALHFAFRPIKHPGHAVEACRLVVLAGVAAMEPLLPRLGTPVENLQTILISLAIAACFARSISLGQLCCGSAAKERWPEVTTERPAAKMQASVYRGWNEPPESVFEPRRICFAAKPQREVYVCGSAAKVSKCLRLRRKGDSFLRNVTLMCFTIKSRIWACVLKLSEQNSTKRLGDRARLNCVAQRDVQTWSRVTVIWMQRRRGIPYTALKRRFEGPSSLSSFRTGR